MKSYIFKTTKGWGALTLSDKGLYRLTIPVLSKAEAQDEGLTWGTLCPLHQDQDAQGIVTLVQDYMKGRKVNFRKVKVDFTGVTPFRLKAYHELRQLDYGETLSYGELAFRLGRPMGARAVGQAMGKNRVPLVIPCHRITSSNQKLTGFSAPGGTDTQRWLLGNEGLQL